MTPSADNAVEVLEKLKASCGPELLAYWVLPNVIVTLSGARAYCDGVFWGDARKGSLEVWNHEIGETLQTIKNTTPVIFSEYGTQNNPKGENFSSYEIIFEVGLKYVLSKTKLLNNVTRDDLTSLNDAKQIIKIITTDLKNRPRFNNFKPENLEHMAFGILVGYPDIAITESVLLWEKDDRLGQSLVDADIRGASYYDCPQPVYSYPRHLANDKEIKANEDLWSKILSDYYNSTFHKSLESDPTFMAKMKELGNLRQ
jgi:hypothetical protein